MRSFPKKKYSLYNATTGKVRGVKPNYLDEGHKPTICGENTVLANMINDSNLCVSDKSALLLQLDIIYDMGKRMGNKMLADHKASGNTGGWRDGY